MSSSCVALGFLSVVMAPMLMSPARASVLTLRLPCVCLTFPLGISSRHVHFTCQYWNSSCLFRLGLPFVFPIPGNGHCGPHMAQAKCSLSSSTLLYPSCLKVFHYNSAESTVIYLHVRPCVYGCKGVHYIEHIQTLF